jgi:hypothetical protein
MKVRFFPCIQCEKENADNQYIIEAELRDDLAFGAQCPNGHSTLAVWEAQKFEILFQMGTLAFLDGYCREAISSFAAAQERFHEFCIKVFMASNRVNTTEFARTWRLVSNQSERQLGAYYFLHLLFFDAAAPVSPKMVEFRNNVIHKGFIASRAQAFTYAEYIYGYIIAAVRQMRPRFNGLMELVTKNDLEEMLRSVPKGTMARSIAVPTMIGLSRPPEKFGFRSFTQVLKDATEDHIQELRDLADELEEHQTEDEEG